MLEPSSTQLNGLTLLEISNQILSAEWLLCLNPSALCPVTVTILRDIIIRIKTPISHFG